MIFEGKDYPAIPQDFPLQDFLRDLKEDSHVALVFVNNFYRANTTWKEVAEETVNQWKSTTLKFCFFYWRLLEQHRSSADIAQIERDWESFRNQFNHPENVDPSMIMSLVMNWDPPPEDRMPPWVM